MSLSDKKQEFITELKAFGLLPPDPIHRDTLLRLVDKFVAGLEEPSGSTEPDPASPQEITIERGEGVVLEQSISPLPSAADLDAVAEEVQIAEATNGSDERA